MTTLPYEPAIPSPSEAALSWLGAHPGADLRWGLLRASERYYLRPDSLDARLLVGAIAAALGICEASEIGPAWGGAREVWGHDGVQVLLARLVEGLLRYDREEVGE